MAFDRKVLDSVTDAFSTRRLRRQIERQRRREEMYTKEPRIQAIDAEISSATIAIVRSTLVGTANPLPRLEALREQTWALREERSRLLEKHGKSRHYLDDVPDCEHCDDTGFLPSGPCACLIAAYAEAQKQALELLLPVETQTFDTFDLNFYSRSVNSAWGMSPRENIERVADVCKEFAYHFGALSGNLFLSGGTGLGKTFLAAAIAGAVTEKGLSVLFAEAADVVAVYEKEKFQRDEAATAEIGRFLACDLMIVDDLGSELASPFSTSALFSLINTRLLRRKKIVVISSLSEQELGKRYSAQLLSRLNGEFIMLPFFGE
ncbi:ATP-binding protein, partial [Oscillospiraceae bacterium OttesenSCG-928-F05]|nr:ATP-binding protein [Oscillospiraceae bacterium OttesenSCG-928-F05]